MKEKSKKRWIDHLSAFYGVHLSGYKTFQILKSGFLSKPPKGHHPSYGTRGERVTINYFRDSIHLCG